MEHLIPHNYFFTFDLDHMLDDMRAFNPLEYRYQIASVKRRLQAAYTPTNGSNKAAWKDAYESWWLDWQRQFEHLVYEDRNINAPGDPMELSTAEDLQNLQLIYGKSEPIEDFLKIYDLVQTKFVRDYLAIDGLAKIMSKEYFKYEWEMQLQFNYDKQQQSYLRDHFIHQMKDMYEVFRFFIETIQTNGEHHYGYLDQLLDWVNTGETQISDYILQHAKQEMHEISKSPLRRNLYNKLFGKFTCEVNDLNYDIKQAEFFDDPPSPTRRASEKSATDHIARNIIQSSFIMAALFHDIGYPIAHTIKNRTRLSQYLPSAISIISAHGAFSEIKNCLADSLLFRIEGSVNVEALYNQEKHGTLSALAFLLSFYQSGSIQSLSPEKKAAVELAALIMSDHTNNFMILGDGANKFRLSANRNPLSFLLKFCDEIQEWGREYYFISENKSLRICNICKKPIVAHISSKKIIASDFLNAPFEYRICDCHKPNKAKIHDSNRVKDSPFRKSTDENMQIYTNISSMSHRKINHVAIAERVRFFKTRAPISSMSNDEMEIYRNKMAIYLRFLPINEYGSITANDPTIDARSAFIVQLDYNLYNLLQYSFIDPGFSLHRSKDINKLKKMLDNNIYFPGTLIYADVTSNPISLKVKILDRFLYSMRSRLELAFIELYKLEPQLFDNNINEVFNIKSSSKYYDVCSNIYQIMKMNSVIERKSFTADDGGPSIRNEIKNRIINAARNMKLSIGPLINTRYDNLSNAWQTNFDLSCLKIYTYLFSPYLHGMAQIADIENNTLFKADDNISELERIWELLYDESFRRKVVSIRRNKELYLLSLNAHKFIHDTLDDEFKIIFKNAVTAEDALNILKELGFQVWIDKYLPSEIELIWHNVYGIKHKADAVKLHFYIKLLIAAKLISYAASSIKEIETDKIKLELYLSKCVDYLTNTLMNDNVAKDFSSATKSMSIEVLIKEFITQESRQIRYYEHARTGEPLPSSYYEIFEHNENVVTAIKDYSDSRHYAKALEYPSPILDNHSDLLLFWILSKSSQ